MNLRNNQAYCKNVKNKSLKSIIDTNKKAILSTSIKRE
jgi:hypothetical protein